MKKRVSKPPSSRQSARGASSRQPVTIPTSRTVSRFQPPIASGSKSREPLNAVDSIVAKQTRLQSDGCAQHEPGLTRPVGIERAAAVEPVLGARAREAHEAVERAVVHDRVRVEQQQVLAARLLGGAVDSGGEAEVLVEREQPDVRELCADHLRGTVAGVVVEHDHLERRGRSAAQRARSRHSRAASRHL